MLGSMLVDYLLLFYPVVATVRMPSQHRDMPNVEWRLLRAEDEGLPIADCQWAINAIGIIPQRLPQSGYVQVNSAFPRRLAAYAHRNGIRLIHASTDCVFSGRQGWYAEDCRPDATDAYGQAKILGEVDGVCNLRCSLVGHGPNDSHSLLGWFLNQEHGATVPGYSNHLWNGLTTLHFAKICRAIIETNITPAARAQHIVPTGYVSKYRLLRLFREYFRPDITVEPVKTPDAVNRTLATIYPEVNQALWEAAGYLEPPTIDMMVGDLSEWMAR